MQNSTTAMLGFTFAYISYHAYQWFTRNSGKSVFKPDKEVSMKHMYVYDTRVKGDQGWFRAILTIRDALRGRVYEFESVEKFAAASDAQQLADNMREGLVIR